MGFRFKIDPHHRLGFVKPIPKRCWLEVLFVQPPSYLKEDVLKMLAGEPDLYSVEHVFPGHTANKVRSERALPTYFSDDVPRVR